MRPAEVLDGQADLLDKAEHAPNFRTFMDTWGGLELQGYRGATGSVVPALTGWARAGYAYRVTHDMSLLVEHAAASLDESDTFDVHAAPTGCGVLAFDRPIPLQEIRGRTMLIHWLVWGPVEAEGHPALGVVTFNDRWREPDEVEKELDGQASYDHWVRTVGRWAPNSLIFLGQGMSVGPSMIHPTPEAAAEVLADGGTPYTSGNVARIVQALFMLLNQTVTEVAADHLPRPARRRAEKAGLPSKVTVIRLRRHEHANRGEEESLVAWSHRWVVRGHWAWRKCSEGHPGAQEYPKGWRVRVWIGPYVKGPEDAPFVQSEKVYSLQQ